MTGNEENIAAAETERIRQSFTLAAAAIMQNPEVTHAFRDASALAVLLAEERDEIAGFRAWCVFVLYEGRRINYDELGVILDLSGERVGQLVRKGRKLRDKFKAQQG